MGEKIEVTDEWLYQYMPIVDEAIIRELEKATDYEHQFSSRFERRMKKMINEEAHPEIGKFYRLLRGVAILFVCVASALFIITMSVQAYRTKFFETVKSICKDSILYTYFIEENQSSIQCKEPGYVPEGYQETERIVLEHWFSVVYTNTDDKTITWDQMLVQNGGNLIVDIEYDQQIIKEVNGRNVIISLYQNGFMYAYCEYDEYVYVLTADNISIDDVCMMFDSIGVN